MLAFFECNEQSNKGNEARLTMKQAIAGFKQNWNETSDERNQAKIGMKQAMLTCPWQNAEEPGGVEAGWSAPHRS